MFKVVETFSGIGSQAQALDNIGIDYEIQAISEWEIAALYAYDIIHNGKQDLSLYRHHTKESLVEELKKYSLSNNGSKPISELSLYSMSNHSLKSILYSIERTNNLVDITKVHASSIPEGIDLLTYSFPCQDLSIAGRWHQNEGGIDKGANNRSTLLWEIQRLLHEHAEENRKMPRFLLMENVRNILSEPNISNFREWQKDLEELGYVNQVWTLDARNFGVPQSRVRTFMLSVQADSNTKELIQDYFYKYNLEDIIKNNQKQGRLEKYLRLDYSQPNYRKEAIESTPVLTPSRQKIYMNNEILASDNIVFNDKFARTVTTKQDRNPNSGIVEFKNIQLVKHNSKYRNLTPRECFLLMGFPEDKFDLLMENNPMVAMDRKILPNSKLIKLAGNSIVVDVLEDVFKFVMNIDSLLKQREQRYKIEGLYERYIV